MDSLIHALSAFDTNTSMDKDADTAINTGTVRPESIPLPEPQRRRPMSGHYFIPPSEIFAALFYTKASSAEIQSPETNGSGSEGAGCVGLSWSDLILCSALRAQWMRSLSASERLFIVALQCLRSISAPEGPKESGRSSAPISAGHVLSSLCWHAVLAMEQRREPWAYELCVHTLQLLLSNPFTGRRRRRWVDRLCIDLCHLGRAEEALGAALKWREEAQAAGQVGA